MFPIRDLNPTRITPIITIGLIALNVAVFLLWQPRDSVAEETEFLYEYAAVACEFTTGEPLTEDEIARSVGGPETGLDYFHAIPENDAGDALYYWRRQPPVMDEE